MTLTFAPDDFNNSNYFMPVLNYNGTASSPFTLDNGYLGKGQDGVSLLMTEGTQGKLSATNYMLYGKVEAALRHEARAGLVATFILMSDVEDEIDWEFTTADPTNTQTNTFGMQTNRQPKTLNQTSPWNVNDVHVYGFNWQPEQLEWLIDGKVVRTLKASQAKGYYPQSPSRVQFSLWAGGNATVQDGVKAWAGGAIDWGTPEYQKQGYYGHEFLNYTVKCNHADSSPTRRDNNGTTSNNTVTSWVYNGKNYTGDQKSQHPVFMTSTTPLSRVDDMAYGAGPGLPGYEDDTNPQVKDGNSWDGSGNQLPDSVRRDATGKEPKKAMSKKSKIKIAIIAAIVVGSVLFVWVLVVFGCRYYWRKKGPESSSLPGVMPGGSAGGYAPLGRTTTNSSSNKYAPLYDAGSEIKMSRTSSPMPEYPPPRPTYPGSLAPQFGSYQQQMAGAPELPPDTGSYGMRPGYAQPGYQYHPY